MRIAIVEDNTSVANGIAYRLQDRGHATDILHDGRDAMEFLKSDENDAVILDINLPGMDGLAILKSMRARGDNRPVLLLTARDQTFDRVQGLDAGADDYLVKPFEMDELEARLRAISRRAPRAIASALTFETLSFDETARQATVNGTVLDLPRRELTLLEALLRANGNVSSKQALLDALYGTGADMEESAVEVIVSRLRKKLASFGYDIRARRGIGYLLAERS
ncbi:MAG: response regulator transcription factor [Thalassovita sp.]|nr:response regulator transcription factor [Thalassovita sp.]